jgi:hypothetical protein
MTQATAPQTDNALDQPCMNLNTETFIEENDRRKVQDSARARAQNGPTMIHQHASFVKKTGRPARKKEHPCQKCGPAFLKNIPICPK